MSTVGGGVNIIKNGLVLYLDVANKKSLADVPSQNLFTYSQDISTGSWSKVRVTITGTTSVTTAPDGTYTAQKLVEDTTTGITHFTAKSSTISGTGSIYTVSMYAKAAERTWLAIQTAGEDPNYITAYFDLTNGVLGSVATGITATMSNSGNGWYRCSITRLKQGTASSTIGGSFCISTTNLGFVYNGDGTSGIYLWGAQLELGSVATTYIPTTTVAVSRVPTWTDLSRGGNNGTLTSGFTYNYSNGGSLVFDGVSNYVNCGNSSNLQVFSQITLSTWVKFSGLDYTGNTGNLITFMSKGTVDTTPGIPTSGLWFAYDNRLNRTSFAYTCFGNTTGGFQGGGNNFNTKPYTFTNGIWYNIVATVNTSSQGALFINGVQQGNLVTFSNLNLSNTVDNLRLGALYSRVDTYLLNGNNSQTSIYNRALSSQEVLQNFNATKTRFGL